MDNYNFIPHNRKQLSDVLPLTGRTSDACYRHPINQAAKGIHTTPSHSYRSSWIIRVLMLLLLMGGAEGKAWGQQTTIQPGSTLNMTNGATYSSIKLGNNGDNAGTYYLNVDGTSTIQGTTQDGSDQFYIRGALIVKNGQTLIIKGNGILEVKAKDGYWEYDRVYNHGNYAVPGIENYGNVIIEGSVCVVATGIYAAYSGSDVNLPDKSVRAPGIGGYYMNRVATPSQHYGTSGPVTLRNGGTLIEVQSSGDHPRHFSAQIPQIIIEDFGCFMKDPLFDYLPSNCHKLTLQSDKTTTKPATNKPIPLNFKSWGSSKNIRLWSGRSTPLEVYFKNTWNDRPTNKSDNYGTLDGIPFTVFNSSYEQIHNIGLYLDDSGNFYKGFQSFNTNKTLTLNVANQYPASGTLEITGGNSTFNGYKNIGMGINMTFNPNGAVFKTSNSGTLQLTNINASGTLYVEGRVYIPSGDGSNSFGVGVVKDNKNRNVPVYQNMTTLQHDHTISKITYGNGNEISCYYLNGKTLYLWLPSGNQNIRIETTEGVIYTVTTTIATTHHSSNSLTVYPTEFDLSKQTLAVNTANSGNQSVDYPNASDGTKKNYTSPAKTPLVFFDSNSSTNNAIIQGGNVANVTLSDLANSTSTSCLKIDGSTIANITLKGTNQLTTTGNYAIDIASGTMNLSGQDNSSLSAKGANADINVNSASGYLNIASGNYSIRAQNSKFKPTNTTLNGGTETTQPTVYMGASATDKYYLTILSNNSGYSEYKKMDGSSLDDQMASKDSKSYFWISDKNNQIQATKDGTAYVLGRNKVVHNFNLVASPIIAKIGGTAYSSIPEAFAAAKSGDVIMLEANNHTITADATLVNIAKGKKVQFNLNGKTLKTAGRTLNANEGVLELTGTGELSGDCHIKGGLYTSGSITLGSIFMDNKQVYRATVSNLATGINSFPYYKLDDAASAYRATYTENGNTVIWLPASPTGSIAIIADGTNATPEPVSEADMKTVNSNHANIATAGPAPDITFGNITFENGTTGIKVTYGTGGKFSQDNMNLSADKRVRLRGNNKNKANQIIVNGLNNGRAVFFTLSNLRSDIGTAAGAAMLINGTANIMLEKESELRGGRGGSNFTAIVIDQSATLTICNSDADKGRNSGKLLAQGSYTVNKSSEAIQQNSGWLKVIGGTLVLLNGDGTTEKAVGIIPGGTPIQYTGGSLRTGSTVRPKTGTTDVYMVTISTGLTPGKPYRFTYKPGKEDVSYTAPKDSYVIPDEDGKIYCWFPKAEAGAADLGQVLLVDPETSQSVSIPIAKVDEHDKNVAPIMISVKNLTTNEEFSYGNLKDAFDALQSGTQGNLSKYKLSLLSSVANLRTEQMLPAYCEAEFNLGSYNVEAVSGTDVSFGTPETSFLHITGKGGNIRNTFKVSGDVFINGIVPLTDATIMREGMSVFRTLVSGLTWAEGNDYTYTYGKNTSGFRPHTVEHNGQKLLLACLWLPDNGSQTELRIVVNSNGSSVEYTAGEITTKTQITEPLPVRTIGVVASVTYGTYSLAYNSLSDAFTVGVKKANEAGYNDTDTQLASLTLMAGSTFASEFTMNGKCRIDLAGKNLLSGANGMLTIAADARIRIIDNNVGMKGSLQTNIMLAKPEDFFIAGSIQLDGKVTQSSTASTLYWRTLVNTSYKPEVAAILYGGSTYPVINGEASLWLQQDNTGKSYDFNLLGKDGNTIGDNDGKVTISNVVISANHQNEMTIGITADEARISTQKYATLQAAFDAAKSSPLATPVELLKTIAPEATITVSSDNTDFKDFTLDLGRYAIEIQTGKSAQLVISQKAMLELVSTGSQGRLLVPVKIAAGSYFFAGQSINGGNLGTVIDNATTKYRLLIKNLPKAMPDDLYAFKYGADGDAKQQTGTCMVRSGVACLWLEVQNSGKKLTFTNGNFSIDNVIIAANHFNTETYGVNEVAQVNGNKYGTLKEAFANGGGKKIVLLKNASLEDPIEVSAKNTELDLVGFNITATADDKKITVNATGTLRIFGKGNLAVNGQLSPSDKAFASNGNLIVEPEVAMAVTSQIALDGTSGYIYRVNVSGLPANKLAAYEYGTQKGEATTSSGGTLCVWLKNSSTLQTFRVDIGENTWLLSSVTISEGHNNPLVLEPAEAVAKIGGDSYNTLEQAFANSANSTVIELSKNTGYTKELKLKDAVTASATFSLGKKKLTLSDQAAFNANAGQLILADGILEGDVSIKGKVFAGGDVRMNDIQVTQENKTVWRMLLTLPAGTNSFSYKIGEGAEVTDNKNILTTSSGSIVACLWLPSAYMAQDMVIKAGGQEYKLPNIVVASTHGNELDVSNGGKPVAKINGSTQYASLASAFAMVREGETISLQQSISPSTVLNVPASATLDLNGQTLTSENCGFSVADGKMLKVTNSKIGSTSALIGTWQLRGKGKVDVDTKIKITGTVLNESYEEIHRVIISKHGVSDAGCNWLQPTGMEHDETIMEGSDKWEATVPTKLNGHDEKLTAYKRIELTTTSSTDEEKVWNAIYENTNLVLNDKISLKTATTPTTIHRITMHDGAKVEAASSATVISTEGIRYKRIFAAADKWESISLPFTPVRITAELPDKEGKLVTTLLSPATGTGTAGHFWLTTINADGSLKDVTTSEMTANVAYLMAVPADLKDKEITFVSGENQILYRDPIVAVKPISGFIGYANGTLGIANVKESFYVLNEAGDTFERITVSQYAGGKIPPFRGYLSADPVTTTRLASFRVSGTPTGIELPAGFNDLRIRSGHGRLILESSAPVHIYIHSINGYCLRSFKFVGGRTEVTLPAGLYIVNRQKVIVLQ